MATNKELNPTISVCLVLQNIAGVFNRFSDEYDELTLQSKNGTDNLFERIECHAKLDVLKYLHNYFKEHYGN